MVAGVWVADVSSVALTDRWHILRMRTVVREAALSKKLPLCVIAGVARFHPSCAASVLCGRLQIW